MTPPSPPSQTSTAIGARTILAFWLPLAATWLMMAVEGPYVAAIIARLADPIPNLAAYGVAFSFAFIAEAPIIMMMTAANALVGDRGSFLALRRFMRLLLAAVTVAMALGLLPPVFRFLTDRLIGLPPDLASRTHVATALLLPWPAAIGYRRFYQGILVRHRHAAPRRLRHGRPPGVDVAGRPAAWPRGPGCPGPTSARWRWPSGWSPRRPRAGGWRGGSWRRCWPRRPPTARGPACRRSCASTTRSR